jgi:hypothetical protein
MRSRAESYLRRVIIGMMATGCLLVCGCHKTVMVLGPSALPAALAPNASEADKVAAAKKELPGIPFYNHYGVCTKETVWLEPQTTLSLTVTADGGKPVTQAITLNNQAFHDPTPTPERNANSLVTALNEAQGKHQLENTGKFCPAEVAKYWGAVRDAYKVTPIKEISSNAIQTGENDKTLVRVSNTADIGTAVDYSRVYYLNARSPLIGTGTVDAKLNPDGTLGEGSASVDDETLGDVLSAAATVGSGGLTAWSTVAAARISGAASIQAAGGGAAAPNAVFRDQQTKPSPCAAKDGWPEVSDNVTYEFTVAPGGFKHDYKSVTPLEQLGGKCQASDVVVGGSYTVTPLGEDSKPDKKGVATQPNSKDGAPPPKP